MIARRTMKCCGLIVLLMLSVTSLFGWGWGADYIPLVQGTLTFTFQPQVSGGTDGTWQAIIITPHGERIAIDPVAYSVTEPVVVEVACIGSEFIEIGAYGIELKNNIVDSVFPFLSSITVQNNCQTLGWDAITYRDIPSLSCGENTLMYYVVPSEALY